jgi:hypothetical protein
MSPADRSTAAPLLFQSDLAQTSLPEILFTVHRHRVPGVIECRRGDEVKRIYVERGNVIFATTTNLSESLGDMLLAEGRITREQYEGSIARLRETGKRHGVTLVEMKLISAAELFDSVRRQIESIVLSLFRWDFGQVTFRPGREKHLEFVKVAIPIPQAILRGVRMIDDARSLVERLGTRTTLFARTEEVIELSREEHDLLELVNGRRALFELVAAPPLSQSDNARILYAFSVLQLISPVSPRHVKVQIRTS